MLPYPSASVDATSVIKVSPAKARKLESVMRGQTQHGVTQIGFGDNAIDINNIYPMEISKSCLAEQKDYDEYSSHMVGRMSMGAGTATGNRTRRNSQSMTTSPNIGKKRRSEDVPLETVGNAHKRHCLKISNNNSNLMLIDDERENTNERDNYEKEIETLRLSNNALQSANSSLRSKLSETSEKYRISMEFKEKYLSAEIRNENACKSLISLLNEIALSSHEVRQSELIENNKLIGRVVQMTYSINSFQVNDVWEDGTLFSELKQRRSKLEFERSELDLSKKELRKLRSSSKDVPFECALNSLLLNGDILSLRSSSLKQQFRELSEEYSALELRKKLHIKLIRLQRDSFRSRFTISRKNKQKLDENVGANVGANVLANTENKCLVLNSRYILTNLLGKGGFSEVHRAYDLTSHKYVACKIHQLNSHWTDERKKSYTKHATREYDIHKSLLDSNIVSLYDVFGIDVNSFCTVLEYCDGMDLDMYLKCHIQLSERESKNIMIQICSGLCYLHNQVQPIIHYDLKPGNLLYKSGQIKLTDFGLAKIMERNTDQMELTSHGAGTYWYLPPECFVQCSHVMISPKVDIWSSGVIFFQMLFGKRPFGDNMSQDTILSNKTILNAKKVVFPNQKNSNKVSKCAKEFIQQCCAYNPNDRLSSKQIVTKHPYFDYLRKK